MIRISFSMFYINFFLLRLMYSNIIEQQQNNKPNNRIFIMKKLRYKKNFTQKKSVSNFMAFASEWLVIKRRQNINPILPHSFRPTYNFNVISISNKLKATTNTRYQKASCFSFQSASVRCMVAIRAEEKCRWSVVWLL